MRQNRKYIRHPSDIPIEIDPIESKEYSVESLVNVSLGGLSFYFPETLPIGKTLKIRIPLVGQGFETTVQVVWCDQAENSFEIGVKLLDQQDAFRTRMVEQVCHIEHYKKDIELAEGRFLNCV